jgi:lipopolysaccharide/colanic/teichoic acid biosynthesis glycosyltransferase
MNDAKKDKAGTLLPDSQRLTTGVFVRKTSLDELPQLLNV